MNQDDFWTHDIPLFNIYMENSDGLLPAQETPKNSEDVGGHDVPQLGCQRSSTDSDHHYV